MGKRIWFTVTSLVVVGLLFGGITMFGWMISETQFARPDEDFDRLTTQVENLPGVSVEGAERWVEAPTFSDPSSWISLTVDEANLPGLLDTACKTEYPGPVSWSLRVRADGGTVVSVNDDTAPPKESSGSRCLDFGFDAVGLVDEAGGVVPDLELQPAIWENDQFSLVEIELEPDSTNLRRLLPLIAHAEELRDAAGLDSTRSVEINAYNLSLIIEPDEHDRYLALLTDLVEEHGVISYWADGGGTPTDGVEKVQIIAPDREHSAIEADIRASNLHIADLPLRFIPLDP